MSGEALKTDEAENGRHGGLFLEIKALTKLALPLATVQVGANLFGVSDSAIIGRLGAIPLGAVGIGHSVFFAGTTAGNGIMLGFDPLISQALGAGDEIRARHLMWQSIWLAVIAGLLLTVPLLAIAPFLHIFGIDLAVAKAGQSYLFVRTVGLIPLLIFLGVRSYLQAKGETSSLVWGILVANLINVPATIWMAFGGGVLPNWMGPVTAMPALGATGAAIASTLCVFVQLALAAWAIRKISVPGFTRAMRRPVKEEIFRAFRIGLPIGLQLTAEVGLFVIVTFLAGKLGAVDLAAHQVAITLAGISFSVALGIGAAGSIRVGRSIGLKDHLATRRAGFTAFSLGGAFMFLCALGFFAFPGHLAALLTDDPSVLALSSPLLVVAAFYQLSDGFQAIGSGVLRGAGDVKFPFLCNLVGHYCIGVPVAVLLGLHWGLGVKGLWWGIFAALTAVATTLFARFWHLSKKPIRPLVEVSDLKADAPLPPQKERSTP